MTYKGTFKMSVEEQKHYNELLQLDLDEFAPFFNEEDIERLGALRDDYIYITSIAFENGNYITIDLVSGDSNYYDNIVLWDKDGNELMCADCEYTIESFELEYEDDTYIVELELY